MLSSILLVLSGAALSAAQAASTTASPTGPVVSLFLPDTDSQKLVVSVVGSAGSMTTYVITCPEGTDASDCGYSEPVTITEGASSLRYSQVCLLFCSFLQILQLVNAPTYLFTVRFGLHSIGRLHADRLNCGSVY
jgi:hypothetical protein